MTGSRRLDIAVAVNTDRDTFECPEIRKLYERSDRKLILTAPSHP